MANGLFSVQLDFGNEALDGSDRYLETAVGCPADSGVYATISPRQALTPAPYAVHTCSAGSAPWNGLTGVPSVFADNTDNDALSGLSCLLGQTTTWNGSAWVCSDLNPTISTLDADGRVGDVTSITVGEDGLALISYWEITNGDLKAAHCDNIACTSATVNTFAFTDGSSITIGADSLGLISYNNGSNLIVAHCSNTACASVTQNAIGDWGAHTSIVLGTDGLVPISYMSGNHLKVAHCSNHPIFCDP